MISPRHFCESSGRCPSKWSREMGGKRCRERCGRCRTLLTARLWRATTSAYFGFRTWCRGGEFQSACVRETTQNGLAEMKEVAALMRSYPVKPPTAMYDWAGEADLADGYFKAIVVDGWPKEYQAGVPNPNAGMKFPYAGKP